jgi:hypothetical protein
MGDELTIYETINELEELDNDLRYGSYGISTEKLKAIDNAIQLLRIYNDMGYHLGRLQKLFAEERYEFPKLTEEERRARDEAFRKKCEANRNMYGVPVKGSLADGYDVIKVGK